MDTLDVLTVAANFPGMRYISEAPNAEFTNTELICR